MATDPWSLERFVDAHEGGRYATALAELRRGRKTSHWIWYVFPQVAGLGTSPMARRYALSGLEEARAYLAHLVLGPRLLECVGTLTGLDATDPVQVMGSGVDAMKLRSSMTLFARATTDVDDAAVFTRVLDQYFGGEEDPATLRQAR